LIHLRGNDLREYERYTRGVTVSKMVECSGDTCAVRNRRRKSARIHQDPQIVAVLNQKAPREAGDRDGNDSAQAVAVPYVHCIHRFALHLDIAAFGMPLDYKSRRRGVSIVPCRGVLRIV
jgi:hypothetical protein